MTVSLTILIVMAALYACGIYLMLERSMTRVLLGFLLVGNATNLLLLVTAGRVGSAPIVTDGESSAGSTDPLPQALILTAIVITFAVSAFLLALIYRSWKLGTQDRLQDDEDDVALRTGTRAVPGDSPVMVGSEAGDSYTDFVTQQHAEHEELRHLEEEDEAAVVDTEERSSVVNDEGSST